jgi:hypothetical protein
VSCYAIFKGWLLLSQPPYCQRNNTSLSTLSIDLGALNDDLGLFPFCLTELRPSRLTPVLLICGIRRLIHRGALLPRTTFQSSTPTGNTRGQPKSCFGENQLLHNSISFSLQPSSHPRTLYDSRVRPSMYISRHFSLLKGSSSCFGSIACDCRAIHTRFRCGLPRSRLTYHTQ